MKPYETRRMKFVKVVWKFWQQTRKIHIRRFVYISLIYLLQESAFSTKSPPRYSWQQSATLEDTAIFAPSDPNTKTRFCDTVGLHCFSSKLVSARCRFAQTYPFPKCFPEHWKLLQPSKRCYPNWIPTRPNSSSWNRSPFAKQVITKKFKRNSSQINLINK